MELPFQPFRLKPVINRVDARSDDQYRPFLSLRQKIPHWTVKRTGHSYRFALARNQRKRALDAAHRVRLAGQQKAGAPPPP